MKKLLSMAVGAVLVSAAVVTSAFATYDYGQLGSGDIYRVRNVSDNQTSFEKTTNADLCETVQFKVRIHNGGPKTLNNVKVKATLNTNNVSTTHSSTATVTADNNRENAVASGTASVNLSKAGKISYVAGSAELLDDDGARLNSVDSTALFGGGVNIGDVAVSLNNMRFVQFKAKFNCEEEQNKKIWVCELATKTIIRIDEKDFNAKLHSKNLADCEKEGEITVCRMSDKHIVTIKESDFDSSKYTTDLSKCEETPVTPPELPHTGSTGALIAVVASLLTAAVGYAVNSRKNVLG